MRCGLAVVIGATVQPVSTVTPTELLAAALAADAARPLVTFYDDATGERTELSVATFANWVAKTANLLRDDLAVEPGATVAVALPLHWQTLVWIQAGWAAGAVVELADVGAAAAVGGTGGAASPPAVAVVTHDVDPAGTPLGQAADVVSLGLEPLGLPRPGHTPTHAGALDYDRSVHAHADRFTGGPPPDRDAPALRAGGAEVSAGTLARAAADSAPDLHGARLLVTDPLRTVTDVVGALLVPLVGGGAVLVRHADPAATTAQRLAAEQVGAVLRGAPAGGGATAAAAPPAAAGLAGFTPRVAGIA